MRLWSLHPRYLDSAGLNACWREGLLAKHVLLGLTKGYTQHPQLIRFRESADPLLYIDAYLTEVYKEALKRNFLYTKSKIEIVENISKLSVTEGQLAYEFEHLKNKLKKRSPDFLVKMPTLNQLKPHPLFKIVAGDIEKWEVLI